MSYCGEKVLTNSQKLFFLVFFSAVLPVFSERYRISEITYELDNTREKDLARVVPVDKARIFSSKEELDAYLTDLHQRIMNTRAFQSAEIENFTSSDESDSADGIAEEIIPVSLILKASDSKHLLILPYPKYDSNDGLIFKIKAKDVNFAGTMNTLNAGLFAGLKEDPETGRQNPTFGAEFDYSYPFYPGPFSASWNNSLDLQYTCNVNELEFLSGTGFTFTLPFYRVSFVFDAKEKAGRDLDYEEYDDTQYFTSDFCLSLPVKILEIDSWGPILWTPFADAKVSYDKNGISSENDDLASPVLSAGHSLSTKRINWYGNFRSGFSVKIGHTIGYDFKQNETEPSFFCESQAFMAFKYIGMNLRLTGFMTKSNRSEIGELIRGVRDKTKYLNPEQKKLFTHKALKAPSALVLNMDFPIHVITTSWLSWINAIFGENTLLAQKLAWTDKFNFELQLSPFLDIALTKNEITERLFSTKDGWYTGGIEFLVFPERWKGIVMRGSFGIDLGKALLSKKYPEKIDLSWRENVKKYEIYAGIGLHY